MVIINRWKPWFYQGPYVPSGVLYGEGASRCHWLIPGFDAYDYRIDLYD